MIKKMVYFFREPFGETKSCPVHKRQKNELKKERAVNKSAEEWVHERG